MQLGTILLWGTDIDVFRHQLRLAEELGYSVIGVGDSPAAWQDMYVSLTVAALETEHATLTTAVTTPYLRHPSVTASAISSVDTLSGGRANLTIGSGGSALRTIGRPNGATQADMAAYVGAVRSLLGGEAIEWGGHTTTPLVHARPVAIYVSADGPKGLKLAGELADGVVMSAGLNLDLLDRKLAIVREAAAAAGRDPEAVDVRCLSFTSVRDTREEANRDITAFIASTAGMGLKAPHMRAIIPPELLANVERMEREYDATQHTVVGGKNALLLEELGLIEFMTGLNCITGSPEQVRAHLKELESRGVSCVFAPLPGNADPDGTLARLAAAARD